MQTQIIELNKPLETSPTDETVFLTKEYKKLHVKPWSRWLARNIDTGLFTFIVLKLGIFNRSLSLSSHFLMLIKILFIWYLLESIFLCTWGTTVGKWIFNITIRDIKNRKLKFSQAFSRSFWIFVSGEGFGIPIISFFREMFSYKKLVKNGATRWDKNKYIVTHRSVSLTKKSMAIMIILSKVTFLLWTVVTTQNTYSIDSILNKKFPLKIDKETEIVSVNIMNNMINYNCRLRNKFSYELNHVLVKNILKTKIINYVCKDEYSAGLLFTYNHISYNFKDKVGKDITKIQINRMDCIS